MQEDGKKSIVYVQCHEITSVVINKGSGMKTVGWKGMQTKPWTIGLLPCV